MVLSHTARAGDATVWFSDFPDIPLMAGFEEQRDAGLSFDKPEGRIVDASASGRGSPADVYGFYALLLPELGWMSGRDRLYFRDGEVLSIEVTDAGEGDADPNRLTLRIYVRPE